LRDRAEAHPLTSKVSTSSTSRRPLTAPDGISGG
jgi:hypothetical protein